MIDSPITSHDVFSWQGFGKSSGEVYEHLLMGSLTVKELSERTGRHTLTVKRALSKMSDSHSLVDFKTGEILTLVEFDGTRWHARKEISLDKVAELMRIQGLGEQRKRKHQVQREARHRSFSKNWRR